MELDYWMIILLSILASIIDVAQSRKSPAITPFFTTNAIINLGFWRFFSHTVMFITVDALYSLTLWPLLDGNILDFNNDSVTRIIQTAILGIYYLLARLIYKLIIKKEHLDLGLAKSITSGRSRDVRFSNQKDYEMGEYFKENFVRPMYLGVIYLNIGFSILIFIGLIYLFRQSFELL